MWGHQSGGEVQLRAHAASGVAKTLHRLWVYAFGPRRRYGIVPQPMAQRTIAIAAIDASDHVWRPAPCREQEDTFCPALKGKEQRRPSVAKLLRNANSPPASLQQLNNSNQSQLTGCERVHPCRSPVVHFGHAPCHVPHLPRAVCHDRS